MKNKWFLLLFLCCVFEFKSIANENYDVDGVYSIYFSGTNVESFDSASSTFEVFTCGNMQLSLTPREALNDSLQYSMYTVGGELIMKSTYAGQFFSHFVPDTVDLIIKDGNHFIARINQIYDTTARDKYSPVLTDENDKEIEDFSVFNLNQQMLKAGIKNSETLEIDPCNYTSWMLNGVRGIDINNVELKHNDILEFYMGRLLSCTELCHIDILESLTISLLGNDRSIFEGERLLLNASTLGGTYLWSDGSTDSTLLVSEEGTYHVTVTVDDTVMKDSININYIQSTIISELANQIEIGIFPNPSKGVFTIEFENIDKASIEVKNELGQAVFSKLVHTITETIDLSKENKGLYFLSLTSNDGSIVKKLVIN